MTPSDPMPRHEPLLRLIQCKCGKVVHADDFDQHVRDSWGEIGQWIADAAIAAAREAIEETPA